MRTEFPTTLTFKSKNKKRSWDYRTASAFVNKVNAVGKILGSVKVLLHRGMDVKLYIHEDDKKKKVAVLLEVPLPGRSFHGVGKTLEKAAVDLDSQIISFMARNPLDVIEKKKPASRKKSR